MNWLKRLRPIDPWVGAKTYIQFFLGIVCGFIAITSNSLPDFIGCAVGCYLFLEAAFA